MTGPVSMSRSHALSHAQYVLINRLATPLGAFIILILIGHHSDQLLGEYALVMTFYYIMQMLPLLGLTSYVMREVARRPEYAGKYFTTVGVMSMIGCVAVNAICYGFLHAVDYPANVNRALGVIGILIFPGILLFIAEVIFMSLHRTRPVAMVALIENTVRVLLSVVTMFLGGELVALMVVFLITRLGALTAYLQLMKRDGVLVGIEAPDRVLLRETWRVLPGFLIGALLFVIFSRMDFVVLSFFEKVEMIGYYAIGYRLFDIGLVVLTALIMAIFPWVARKFAGARLHFRVAVRAIVLGFAAGLLYVAFVGVLLGEYYVQLFFARQYPQPVLLTQLFLAALFICGMDFVASGILHASDRQILDTKASALGGAANTALLFTLIPVLGIYGAFIAKVSSTLLQGVFKFHWVSEGPVSILGARDVLRLAVIVILVALLTMLLVEAGFVLKLCAMVFVGLILLPVSFIGTGLFQPLRLLRFYWHPKGATDPGCLDGLVDTAVADMRRSARVQKLHPSRRSRPGRPLAALLSFRLAKFLHLNEKHRLATTTEWIGQWLGKGSHPPCAGETSANSLPPDEK